MKHEKSPAIVIAAIFALACTPTAAEILDGTTGGNAHFFFLAPMVPTPSPTGTFDGSLAPVVEICIWYGWECGATLEIYNTETGPGSETVRVVPEDEHYIVNWHTDNILTNFPLAPPSRSIKPKPFFSSYLSEV